MDRAEASPFVGFVGTPHHSSIIIINIKSKEHGVGGYPQNPRKSFSRYRESGMGGTPQNLQKRLASAKVEEICRGRASSGFMFNCI